MPPKIDATDVVYADGCCRSARAQALLNKQQANTNKVAKSNRNKMKCLREPTNEALRESSRKVAVLFSFYFLFSQ